MPKQLCKHTLLQSFPLVYAILLRKTEEICLVAVIHQKCFTINIQPTHSYN